MSNGMGTERRRWHTTLIRRALRKSGITRARIKSDGTTTTETYLDRYDDPEALIAALKSIEGVKQVERVVNTSETIKVVWGV